MLRRVAAVLVLASVAAVVLSARHGAARADFADTGSGAFTISGSVGVMRPGVVTTLTMIASNAQSTRMVLQSVSASVSSAVYTGTSTPAPSVCATYLSPSLPHTWTAWTGPTVIPAASGGTAGSVTIQAPLSFSDAPVNQDACENVTFNLSFSGSAYYTDPTTTAVTASPSPANAGAPVTITATVSPSYSGTAPNGTVTFSSPAGQIGSPVTLTPAGGGDQSTAKVTTSSLPAGTSQITASYTPLSTGSDGGPDFSGSSAATSATVNAACVTAPTSTAGTIIAAGSTYNGSYTVASGKSLWLNGGTIKGTVIVNAGGQFDATGGSITGGIIDDGTSSVQGTAISGSVQSSSAGLSLGYGTTVTGAVQSQLGGPVCLNAVTVGSAIQLQALKSTSLGSVCGTSAPSVSVTSGSEPFQIGGSSTCAGNTISASLQVASNAGKLTIGAAGYGNTVTSSIQVLGNSGGGTLAFNSVPKGSCTLLGDTPGIVGSANTVATGALNTCNRTG